MATIFILKRREDKKKRNKVAPASFAPGLETQTNSGFTFINGFIHLKFILDDVHHHDSVHIPGIA